MADDRVAGDTLRRARSAAGLTQRELADRAGVTQGVVSVYESGRRQPSLPTFVGLLRAAGYEVDLNLRSRRPSGPVLERLRRHRGEIAAAAARRGVAVRGVFGSVARGEEREGSDVDLLIGVPDGLGLLALGRLERELREMLGAEIDLVPEAGLKPRVRDRVLADLRPL